MAADADDKCSLRTALHLFCFNLMLLNTAVWEDQEFELLKMGDFLQRVHMAGIEVIHFPVGLQHFSWNASIKIKVKSLEDLNPIQRYLSLHHSATGITPTFQGYCDQTCMSHFGPPIDSAYYGVPQSRSYDLRLCARVAWPVGAVMRDGRWLGVQYIALVQRMVGLLRAAVCEGNSLSFWHLIGGRRFFPDNSGRLNPLEDDLAIVMEQCAAQTKHKLDATPSVVLVTLMESQ
eukprot:gene32978-42086_t